MVRTPQSSHRSGRSNLYSESRFTNWRPFNPYHAEWMALPANLKPALSFPLSATEAIDVYERPLHADFIRPFSVEDVRDVLDAVPRQFLKGLYGIYLLGGTRKQAKTAGGRLYRYGSYYDCLCSICLYPFPRRRLSWNYGRLLKPDVRHEYERAGAVFERVKDGWSCRFDERSLRCFYLYDVLIHEIGHHMDRDNTGKSRAEFERFAEWFVREYGFGSRGGDCGGRPADPEPNASDGELAN